MKIKISRLFCSKKLTFKIHAIENGFPWDEFTRAHAADYGMTILIYCNTRGKVVVRVAIRSIKDLSMSVLFFQTHFDYGMATLLSNNNLLDTFPHLRYKILL